MRKLLLGLCLVFLLTGIAAAETQTPNVALHAQVALKGGPFFTGGWGSGQIVSPDTIVDGAFSPRHNQWDQGPVWWDSRDGVDRSIEIDLGGMYRIESFTVQADDNDGYLLYYWDAGAQDWQLAWDVPNYDAWGWGMQTRPNPDNNAERYGLPNAIVTTALLFRGNMDSGDRLFSVSEIQAFGTPLECISPPSGMIDWWPGDGNAADIVGGNNGTAAGGATFAPGMAGQAFNLDGTGYVRVADDPSLDTPDGFTVDAWIYPRAFGGARVIASKWDDPTAEWSWIFKLHNDGTGRLRIEVSRGGDHDALGDLGGTTILPLNAWSHVAATFDRLTNRLRLYVNGSVDNEGSSQFPGVGVNNSATDLLIGAVNGQTTPPGEFFYGLIDELELYNRGLSPEEIAAIYKAGSVGKCKIREVAIDIKPGGFPNSINLGSSGTVPVAIFSASPFDATTIDPVSVTLAGAAVQLKGKGTPMAAFEDVNGDGLLDLVVHVSTEALQLSDEDTEAVLEGKTFGGLQIRGVDSIRIVP